jgi:hypothetical protein
MRKRPVTDIRGVVVNRVGPGTAFLDVYDTPAGAVCGGLGSVKINTTQFNADFSPNSWQQLYTGTYSLANNDYLCLVETGTDSWTSGNQVGIIQPTVQ